MTWNSNNFRPNQDIPDLTGQTIIVTGGNVGLGLATIRYLAKHNPTRIYLAARSAEKAESAIQEIAKDEGTAAPISHLLLDLSSFDSIKNAARQFLESETRLDILVNNAGIMMVDEGLTKEGYEIQFGTNHMGGALLTDLLLPILRETTKINPQTRVVNVASAIESFAPKDPYNFDELKTTMPNSSSQARYCISKLANVHYNATLARHHPDVRFVCVHPGIVTTNLQQNVSGIFWRWVMYSLDWFFATAPEQGALSQVWASVSPDAKSGEYYAPVGKTAGSEQSLNRDLSEKLWEWTQEELRSHH